MDPRSSAFDALDVELRSLSARPVARRTVTGWLMQDAEVDVEVEDPELDVLVRRLRRQSPSDDWLSGLLRRAGGDGVEGQWAAVVAAWALQPSVRTTARSLAGLRPAGVEGRQEVAACVVAALWQVVREYPLLERPQRIALTIAWEVRRRALAELRRPQEVPVGQIGEDHDALDSGWVAGPDVLAERRELAARAREAGLEAYLDLPGELAAASDERVAVVELLVELVEAQLVPLRVVREVASYYRYEAVAAGGSSAAVRQRRSRAVRRVRAAAREWVVAA